MAIQMRRGASKDFDPEKMLSAEIAITIDGTRKVYAAFAPGDYKELASKEDVQNIVDDFTGSVDKKVDEAVKKVIEEEQRVLDSIPEDYQETVEKVTQQESAISSLTQSKADAVIVAVEGGAIVPMPNSAGERYIKALTINGGNAQAEEPTQDNPQEINGVVVSEVKVHGKNFLDLREVSSSESNGITFSVKGDGGISFSGWAATGNAHMSKPITLPKGTYIISHDSDTASLAGVRLYYTDGTTADVFGGSAFTVDNTVENIDFIAQVEQYVELSLTIYPMIRETNIPDDTYEPYQENFVTLSQPIELSKWDSLSADGFKQGTGRMIVTGEEDWKGPYSGENDSWYVGALLADAAPVYAGKANMLCTRYTVQTTQALREGADGVALDARNFLLHDSSVSTVEELKAKLKGWYDAGEPMEIVYSIGVPSVSVIPEEDQKALRSLLTYSGVTYLECDSEVPAIFEVEYVADTKKYIDNKKGNDADLNALVKSVIADMFVPISQDDYDELVKAGEDDDDKYYFITMEEDSK